MSPSNNKSSALVPDLQTFRESFRDLDLSFKPDPSADLSDYLLRPYFLEGKFTPLPYGVSLSDLQDFYNSSAGDNEKWADSFGVSVKRLVQLRRKIDYILQVTNIDSLNDLDPNFLKRKEVIQDVRSRMLSILKVGKKNGVSLNTTNKKINERLKKEAEISQIEAWINSELESEMKEYFKVRLDELKEEIINISDTLSGSLAHRTDVFESYALLVRNAVSNIIETYLDLKPEELLNDVVRFSDDPAKLLLRALLSDNENERFESDRRLELIWLMRAIKSEMEPHKKGMEFFTEILNETFDEVNGEKGGLKPTFLVGTHDLSDGNSCIMVDKYDKRPDFLGENQFLEATAFRGIRIDDDIEIPEGSGIGEDCMVHFGLFMNQKKDDAQLLKILRDDRSINETLRDLNRTRMLFENPIQRDLVLQMIERRVPYELRRDKLKTEVGGKNPNRPAIPCFKFNWIAEDEKGKRYDLEVQCISSFQEYFDFMLMLKYERAWFLHEADRLFDGNVFKQLFPNLELDEEAIRNRKRREFTKKSFRKKRMPDQPMPEIFLEGEQIF